MSESAALRELADVVDILEDHGVEVTSARDVSASLEGDVARATICVDIPLTDDSSSSTDEEAQNTREPTQNPYEPTDFGYYATMVVDTNQAGSPRLTIPGPVRDWFDTSRAHFRKRDGRVELAPTEGPDECIDYKLENGGGVGNDQVFEQLDVVPGDEVHFEADDEAGVVVVEPNRIARRESSAHIDTVLEEHDLTDNEAEIVEALIEHGEQSGSELQTVTGQNDTGIYQKISNLVDDNLVEKRPDPDDGRRTLYSLSEQEEEADEERRQAEAVFG